MSVEARIDIFSKRANYYKEEARKRAKEIYGDGLIADLDPLTFDGTLVNTSIRFENGELYVGGHISRGNDREIIGVNIVIPIDIYIAMKIIDHTIDKLRKLNDTINKLQELISMIG